MTHPIVVLVGAPGSGKTTVGRMVAERLAVRFRDTDTDVEERVGKTVSDVFVEDGEERFRALERAAVRIALVEHHGVLALGGGAILDAGTRALLRDHHVVFLDVGPADAARRVGLAQSRPLLVGNPRTMLRRQLEARRPFYEDVAAATVQTDGRDPAEVADDVLGTLKETSCG